MMPAARWVAATLDMKAELRSEPNISRRIDARRRLSAAVRADEYFRLCAGNRVRRRLRHAVNEHVVPARVASDYAAIARHLADVRNMREHEDEYLLGAGTQRGRFVHHDPVRRVVADATWTVSHEGDYLLGGRLLSPRSCSTPPAPWRAIAAPSPDRAWPRAPARLGRVHGRECIRREAEVGGWVSATAASSQKSDDKPPNTSASSFLLA